MSNKQNDIIQETAYEAQCEDMRMWAVENQIDDLQKNMQEDRLKLTAERIRGLAQQKTIDLLSKRLDGVLRAVVTAKEGN